MGYLPFGDGNQLINRLCNYHHVPMEGNQISEGKSILVLIYNHIIVPILPSEYEQLVRSLLTVDVTVRPFIAEVLSHMWMTSFPSVRPSWEGPCGGKHTIQNSLPSIFHSVNSSARCYDVEVHSPRLPSNDQQDTMNAMDTTDAETALPVRVYQVQKCRWNILYQPVMQFFMFHAHVQRIRFAIFLVLLTTYLHLRMNQLLQITLHQSATLYLNQLQVPFSQLYLHRQYH